MRAELTLSGQLYWYDKEHRKKVLLNEPANLSIIEVLNALGVPSKEVSAFVVNGVIRPLDYLIQDGDKIELVPVIGGG